MAKNENVCACKCVRACADVCMCMYGGVSRDVNDGLLDKNVKRRFDESLVFQRLKKTEAIKIISNDDGEISPRETLANSNVRFVR
jgi:hypothetical protein